ALRPARRSGSARKRSKLTITAPSDGSAASSATGCQESSDTRPFLSSCIETLLEGGEADPAHRVEETLLAVAGVEIGAHDVVDRADDVLGRDGRADDGADRGVALGAAA